jgi:hypothetical protein
MNAIHDASRAFLCASLACSFALIPALAGAQVVAMKKDKECKIAHAVCDFEINVVTYAEPTGPKGKTCDVIVDPPVKEIEMGKYDAKLEWEMEKGSYDAGWRILVMPGIGTNPQFHGQSNGLRKYNATDRNTDAAAGDVAHVYNVVLFNVKGGACSSDPTIVNKGTGLDKRPRP